MDKDATISPQWDIVKDWSEQSRYACGAAGRNCVDRLTRFLSPAKTKYRSPASTRSQLGADQTSGGALSLWDSPKPGASNAVDWQAYCASDVDLILVNVDRRSAECYVGPVDANASSKSLVSRLDDLEFGG